MTAPLPPRTHRHSTALAAFGGLLFVLLAGTLVLGGRPSTQPVASSASLRSPSLTASFQPTPSAARTPDVPSPSHRVVAAPSPAPVWTPTPDPLPTLDPLPSADPGPTLDPPPAAGAFAMNLYREGAFASQATRNWCVPGSMQTMINIMSEGSPDDSRQAQAELYDLARELSSEENTRPGADPEGWADGLSELGHGPYTVQVEPTRRDAIAAAARAIRMTGRPVGLLVWRGAHSWVMSGFRATADPAYTDDYTVSAVYIQDVWYPRVSSIWGASQPPNTLVSFDNLREDYLPWRRPTRRHPDKDGQFVLVLPTAEASTEEGIQGS